MHVELVVVTLVPHQVGGTSEELSAPVALNDAHKVIVRLLR